MVGASERERARRAESCSRRVGLARAQQRVAASQQHRTGVVLSTRQLERLQRPVEPLRRVLVGEPFERPVTGADEHLGCPASIRGGRRLEQVHRDFLEVVFFAEFGQCVGGASVKPGAAQDVALVEHRLANKRVSELEPPRTGAGRNSRARRISSSAASTPSASSPAVACKARASCSRPRIAAAAISSFASPPMRDKRTPTACRTLSGTTCGPDSASSLNTSSTKNALPSVRA